MARSLKIGAQGRLVLPSAMRRELGLQEGDELAASLDDGRIVLEPRAEVLRRLRAELRSAAGDRNLVNELIADRRREATRERSD